MIKFLKILLILPCLFSSSNRRATTTTLGKFTYIQVSPYSYYERNVAIRFKYSSRVAASFTFIVYATYSSNTKQDSLYNETLKVRSLDKELSYEPTLFYKDTILHFVIRNANKVIIESHNVNLKQFSSSIQNENVNGEHQVDSLCYIYTPTSGEQYISESFEFNNFDTYKELDKYQRLDFSTYRFKFSSYENVDLTYYSAFFLFLNSNGWLNDVDDKSGNACSLKLKINYDEEKDEYYLSLLNDLYIDPVSLKSSSSYKEGYVKTNYLYFPYEGLSNSLIDYALLTLCDVGLNKSNFLVKTTFSLNKTLLGDCSTSTYCVKENYATPDFVSGKTKEFK